MVARIGPMAPVLRSRRYLPTVSAALPVYSACRSSSEGRENESRKPRRAKNSTGSSTSKEYPVRRLAACRFHAKRKRGDRHVRAGHSVPQVEPSATRGATDEARDVRGPQAPC